jgi:hypothetical protein
MNEAVLLDEESMRFGASVEKGVDLGSCRGDEATAFRVPCKVCDRSAFGLDVIGIGPLELAWWGRLDGFCG